MYLIHINPVNSSLFNPKTKNRVFTSYPHRKPEIMESYSVSFHNFRFPGGDRVKNAEKWLCFEQRSNAAGLISSQKVSACWMRFRDRSRHAHQPRRPKARTQPAILFASQYFFVTPLKFFYIATAPLCLTRENAREGTAGRVL